MTISRGRERRERKNYHKNVNLSAKLIFVFIYMKIVHLSINSYTACTKMSLLRFVCTFIFTILSTLSHSDHLVLLNFHACLFMLFLGFLSLSLAPTFCLVSLIFVQFGCIHRIRISNNYCRRLCLRAIIRIYYLL